MLQLILTIATLIASIAFYVIVLRACRAIIVMACKMDHGHGEAASWCHCGCHRQKQAAPPMPNTPPPPVPTRSYRQPRQG